MTDIKYWSWAQGTPQFTKDSAALRVEWEAAVRTEITRIFEEWTNLEPGEPHEPG